MSMAMNTSVIKGRLHEYIEQADNKHLEAIYVLLEKEIAPPHQYDAATLEMFYQRVDNDLKGLSKSYTVEEAIASVRNTKR